MKDEDLDDQRRHNQDCVVQLDQQASFLSVGLGVQKIERVLVTMAYWEIEADERDHQSADEVEHHCDIFG